MKGSIRARMARAYQKNANEVWALLSRRMPSFVTGGGLPARPPVFCFHDVEPERFEAQLAFLAANGYRTLSAEDTAARLAAPEEPGATTRDVTLTFDDGTWTFWAYVLPLLERYQLRATLFVIAGMVPEGSNDEPTLADFWAGRVSATELAARAGRAPLCSWRELATMHASGLVDIQSHSMTHSRVPISSRVLDYFYPNFPLEAYGNVNVPVPAGDDPRQPQRRLALGAPIFESVSRMAGQPRFKEADPPLERLTAHVAASGGSAFFERAGWRRELSELWQALAPASLGDYETEAEMEDGLAWELRQSKHVLESRLPGHAVTQFCYPWFQGSAVTDRIAAAAGYRAVHYGLTLPKEAPSGDGPLRIPRLSEEYLTRLPGEGRERLRSVWARRLRGSVARARGG